MSLKTKNNAKCNTSREKNITRALTLCVKYCKTLHF